MVRCDATTVSAYHEVEEGGLIQFGHSKDDPSRPQLNVMMASLDPMGMPLASNVVSGEQADDGFYRPLIERFEQGVGKPGVLFVGDCKMSAFDIRRHLSGHQHLYLSPLPLTGATAKEMPQWISQGIAKAKALELESITKLHDKDEEVEIAQGYEFECHGEAQEEPGRRQWQERVLVIRSLAHAQQQFQGLDKRLSNAERKLWALTPARG